MRTTVIVTFTLVASLVGAVLPVFAQSREEQTVKNAAGTLDEIMAIPLKKIPESLLSNAEAVAIIPNVVKGGFVVGVRHGRGVLVTRDGEGNWQPPLFLTLSGGSVGWQAGVQATDVVLVFATRKSVDNILMGKLTLGVDAAAAAGPVGRQAAAATDATLKAEIYSYSRSRGLFAGVSFDGSVLEIDSVAGQAYYNASRGAGQELADGALPDSALTLLERLSAYAGSGAGQDGVIVPSDEPAPALANANSPDAEATRQQLAMAATRLDGLVDSRWRRYLALPPAVYSPDRSAQAADLERTLARFDAVAADARYESLSSRTEFTEVHQLLRGYAEILNRVTTELVLPPPPQ